MLRSIAALLLLANAAFFAWSQGWLGEGPNSQREPSRLQRQVRPDAVRVLPPQAASAALQAAERARAPQCPEGPGPNPADGTAAPCTPRQ